MKYAGEIVDLMSAYPSRRFRVVELVRHVTHARTLSAKERESVRKAVRRVLDLMVANGTAHVVTPATAKGSFAEYSMSHYWDISATKVGRNAGQYGRSFAP